MSVTTSQSSGLASSGFESPEFDLGASENDDQRLQPPQQSVVLDRSLLLPIKRRRQNSSDLDSLFEHDYEAINYDSHSEDILVQENELLSLETSSLELVTHSRSPCSQARTNNSPYPISQSHRDDGSSNYSRSLVSSHQDETETQAMLSTIYGIHSFINGRDKEKEIEARRMAEFLTCCETGRLSAKKINLLLRTNVVRCTESYDVLKAHIQTRSHVKKRFALMCPSEHMAHVTANSTRCRTSFCTEDVSEANRYWYRFVSEMIRGLCWEKDSFHCLMSGCEAAYRAVMEGDCEVLYDYYDGDLFRRMHGTRLQRWNSDKELHVFLTLSSDGFEEFATRSGTRSAWPLAFVVLNYPPHERFKARNALIASFIPGTHDAKLFDTFLQPIVHDLEKAAEGFQVVCNDMKKRVIYVHVMFATYDYPAASKCMGFVGHMGTFFCRSCHKTLQNVPEARGRYAVPEGNNQTKMKAIRCNADSGFLQWLIDEKPGPRSDRETREVWKSIKNLTNRKGTKTEMAEIVKSTGISRVPVTGRLQLDFVHSIPYDPMHLIFLGWVKLLLSLFLGKHPKTNLESPFVLNSGKQSEINKSLRNGYVGIPSIWGRKPESTENMSGYKAEDFKLIGLFIAPILFSASGMSKKAANLWGCVSEIIHICCDPTPMREEVENLKHLVQKAHVLFTDTFYLDKASAYCFTPTTHAILHLPDMLQQCGPLTNVSQFLVERLVGEVGRLIGSMSRPEANLFHKTHMIFSLSLLNGGLCSSTADEYYGDDGEEVFDDHELVHTGNGDGSEIEAPGMHKFLGKGVGVDFARVIHEIEAYVGVVVGSDASNLQINHIQSFEKCRFGAEGTQFDVETYRHFRGRLSIRPNSRQKCWIAGIFESNDGKHEGTCSYYGRVRDFWLARAQYTKTHELGQTQHYCTFRVAKIDWQYGIAKDRRTGMLSVKNGSGERKGSTRHIVSSIEAVECIDRLIGFFDHEAKRYFLDMERRRLQTSQFDRLGGMLKN